MWLVGVGGTMAVATGCGCKEVYRFPHTTYPYSSCICSFLQQHPYFLFIFKNVFRSLIYIYIYRKRKNFRCKKISRFMDWAHNVKFSCSLIFVVQVGVVNSLWTGPIIFYFRAH